MCFLWLKKSVAGTIMEPVILVPTTLETQGSSPLALIINPVCMKKVSSYNVCILVSRNSLFFQFVVTFISYLL